MSVASIKDANHFSITRLAVMFGHTRETIGRKLKESGVKPCSKQGGYPVYDLKDVAEFTGGTYVESPNTENFINPDRMHPKDRDSWYSSEIKRRKLEKDEGELLDKNETQEKVADLLKKIALTFDTLADVMERDVGLSPEQIEKIYEVSDNVREELANSVIASVNGER